MRNISLTVENLAIPEIKIIRPVRHGDHRGYFSETFNQRTLAEFGIDTVFVQDNHAYSAQKGTVRGLHFQIPPFAQHKLIRVVRGAILDVVVDLRVGSPTYAQHVTAVVSADEWNQILVPAGFAHGLVTLEAHTEVLYKVSAYYSPAHDKGILWNDPALRIDWPVSDTEAFLSDKDTKQPLLHELPPYFHYRSEAF